MELPDPAMFFSGFFWNGNLKTVAIWPIKWKLMADDYERERHSP
jgi:hypothetical protein